MIKRLRIQFVCVIMAIVMVLSAGILGVVVHFTAKNMQMQSIDMMRAVSSGPRHHGVPGKPENQVRLPFIVVELNHSGEPVGIESGYFDLTDREDILKIVDAALATGKESGVLREYDLRFLKSKSPMGHTLVFSDTSAEVATLRNLILSCLLIFCVAMLIFLGISILLSHWVIKPVAVAWDQQRQFVADASHELKTPLTVIMANAELLQSEDCPTGDDREQYAKNILAMTYQMRTLVENLLNMARVDNGTVPMHMVSVDFSQLVSDAVLSVQLLYEEKSLSLHSRITEGIRLNGSEPHLFQLLDVLLDNALKYSAPNAEVRVALLQSGRCCTLSVSNAGEPISKEDLKNIFKRFYRADKARTMNGSYGLGLAIAESIVKAHRGRIWAESQNGCNTFFVQLPASSPHHKVN